MRKALLTSLFVLSVIVCLCTLGIQEISAQSILNSERNTGDYFPLSSGSRYTYRCSYSGKTSIETTVVQSIIVNNIVLYYFLDENDLEKANPIIDQEGPGLHAFYIKDRTTTSIICTKRIICW